jgi:uncharacterized lipoprotein YddW (UPF0748 family)
LKHTLIRTLLFAGMMCGLIAGLFSCVPAPSVQPPSAPVMTEFRGVWIATVDNIDWPSRPGLDASDQQRELIKLLDRAQQLHLNAVLLQVRPGCDALYPSKFEPWSVFLSGTAGQPPQPEYDPLAFAISEAHRRGMELHAWVNPFRVRIATDHSIPAVKGVERQHPQWVRQYGNLKWLDPGDPNARDYSLAVLADIVQRYPIDGIHIDDYFYPYPQNDSAGKRIPFPDQSTFAEFGKGQPIGDWRRGNINDFVHRFYQQTKTLKPAVKVGISPFGIWRPGNPGQIVGFDAYDKLYADSRLWLQQGWCDYLTPQLYWPIDRTAVSYPVLLNWWKSQNTLNKKIWPGLNAVGHGNTPEEIEYQIRTTRGFGCDGEVLFGASKFLSPSSTALADHLRKTVYAGPAILPPLP